jgi:hypothetical protein
MGSKTLYVTENPIIIPDAAREVRLIEGAKDIFFEYYHKGPTDEKGSWVDDWTDKQVIPERIRVTISRDKQVLALIIPLKVAAKTQQSSQVAPPKK